MSKSDHICHIALWVALLAMLLAGWGLGPAPAAAQTDAGWDDRFGVPGVFNGDVVTTAVSATGDLYVAGAFRSSEASVGAN